MSDTFKPGLYSNGIHWSLYTLSEGPTELSVWPDGESICRSGRPKPEETFICTFVEVEEALRLFCEQKMEEMG